MKQAMFWEPADKGKIRCTLCPHNCFISEGKRGSCGVRQNKEGILYSVNYAKVTALALDPIEKKPLNRFFPGSFILSAGTFGCNLSCPFCQNFTISAHDGLDPGSREILPGQLVLQAEELKSRGNIGIAYTYNEPSIWYEYVIETAELAKLAGLKNVLVTNGYINEEPLRHLLQFVDAVNIDVKAYSEAFYKKICKGSLENVKRTVEIAASHCHVELTTLVIPGLNDSLAEIENLAKWISSISPEIPLHLSRFFPRHKMDQAPPTPLAVLVKAREIALKSLKYVYLGNV